MNQSFEMLKPGVQRKQNAVICPTADLHQQWACIKFANLKHRHKWATVKKQNCCYKCLNQGHFETDCKSRHCCRIC